MQHAVDAEAHHAEVAPRLDVDVGSALLERVLPEPVDDMDDVLVVGVEVAAIAQLDQLLEVARQRDLAARGLLRLFHRPREREEFPHVAPDVLRIREYQLDAAMQNRFELVGPPAHERFAGRHREQARSHRHREDAIALGVGVGHGLRHRDQVDLQRIDVVIRHLEAAGQPLDQEIERDRLFRIRQRSPFAVGDELERGLEALRARTAELLGVGGRYQTVRHHQLENVFDPQPAIGRPGWTGGRSRRARSRRSGSRAGFA